MRLVQNLVLVCFLVQLVYQVQGLKKKARSGRKDWRMAKLRNMISPMQEEIKQLQKTVGTISNPVHIHMHGVSGVDASSLEDGHEHHKGHKHGHQKDHEHGHQNGDGDDDGQPNQSHVHIHLKIAGGGEESCSIQDGGYPEDEYIFACCSMIANSASGTNNNVSGNVYLRQKPEKPIEVKVDLKGFDHSQAGLEARTSHGFHIHEFADISNGCNSFGGHYNPGGHAHGGPESEHKHAGDWGNIEANEGSARTSFNAEGTLFGRESIIGRGIVVHVGVDDHGKGGTHSSRTTGSAGARIACCAITLCKGVNWA